MSQKEGAKVIYARNWPIAELGNTMQLAAEAGSPTKRLIEPNHMAINRREYRDLVVNGLRAIATGQYGGDYHGVRPSQAGNILDHYEWPHEVETS